MISPRGGRITRDQRAVLADGGRGAVLIDVSGGRRLTLNALAARIWVALEHEPTLPELVDRLWSQYDVRAELLVIDDFAVLAMDPAQAKLAFQVISERYDFRRSTCITTNRAFKDWTKVFPDALNAQVIAERLTERSEHFILEKNYRIPKSS